jgi:hypothetical protein
MERNVLKERLMNKDDKNRHFMLLIIDISKHGAKEMGHVKMAGPGFVNDVTHDDPVLFQKTLRTNRNQSLYFLWNNIEIMACVTIMSINGFSSRYLTFNISEPWFSVECFITSSNRTKVVLQ